MLLINANEVCVNRGENKCLCRTGGEAQDVKCNAGGICKRVDKESTCNNELYTSYECYPKDFCVCGLVKEGSSVSESEALCDLSIDPNTLTSYPKTPGATVMTNEIRISRIPYDIKYIPKAGEEIREGGSIKKNKIIETEIKKEPQTQNGRRRVKKQKFQGQDPKQKI